MLRLMPHFFGSINLISNNLSQGNILFRFAACRGSSRLLRLCMSLFMHKISHDIYMYMTFVIYKIFIHTFRTLRTTHTCLTAVALTLCLIVKIIKTFKLVPPPRAAAADVVVINTESEAPISGSSLLLNTITSSVEQPAKTFTQPNLEYSFKYQKGHTKIAPQTKNVTYVTARQ